MAGGIAQRYCGVLGGGALERAVGCWLLAEPPEDVRHPPLSPEQEDALKQLTAPAHAPMASCASLKEAMGASKSKQQPASTGAATPAAAAPAAAPAQSPWAGKSQAETYAMHPDPKPNPNPNSSPNPDPNPNPNPNQAETDAMHELSGSMTRSKRGRRLSASLSPSALKGLIASQPQGRASTLSVLSPELIRKRVGKVLEEAARAKPDSKWHAVRNAIIDTEVVSIASHSASPLVLNLRSD